MESSAQPLSEIPNDLTSCEHEPLRFIGSIQSVGCLIAFTLKDHRIQAASENVKDFLGREHREVVSEKLEHIIGLPAAEHVMVLLNTLSPRAPRASFSMEQNGTLFDAVVFQTDGLSFIEIEPSLPTDDYTEIMNNTMNLMRVAKDLRSLGTAACEAVHRITGMERAMMYRFLPPHHHGEVIAEHRVLSAHSYFQQRFPASDIPQIARDLYLRNSVRQIPDVNLPTSRVMPFINPTTGKDIDLSDSRLRAVSPIHLEYLRNMKVLCSFSVAVVVDGRLWGLIACHNTTAKRIPVAQRSACDLIGNAFAGQARLLEGNDYAEKKVSFLTNLSGIFETIFNEFERDLVRRHQQIFDTFRVTGVAVVRGVKVDAAGLSPTRSDLQTYAQQFLERMNREHIEVIASDSISKDFPRLPQIPGLACGVLAVQVASDSVAFLFRPELIETITWGGDPRKQLDRKNLGGRMNPRTSFEAWEETIREHSMPWLDYEIEGLRKLKNLIFGPATA